MQTLKLKSPRLKALEDGDVKYIGNPCKYGHNGLRYSNNHSCVECSQKLDTDVINVRLTERLKSAKAIKNELKDWLGRNEAFLERMAKDMMATGYSSNVPVVKRIYQASETAIIRAKMVEIDLQKRLDKLNDKA